MKFLVSCFILFFFVTEIGYAQDSATVKKSVAESIWEIPHKTFREKLLWPHRGFVLKTMREKPVNYNVAYIRSYAQRLVITLPVSTRFLKFSLVDSKSGNKLTFAPNLQYTLGISLSSKWFSFILNSGVKLFNGDNKIKGKTTFQDYQLNIYGRKITTDMFVQHYNGFYIKNSRSFDGYLSDKPYEIREDVNALHMGVSSNYIVNYKRFSYRNSFAFTEQQKKSAGSILVGLYYSYFNADGTPSLVNDPFRPAFDTLSFIRRAQTQNFGLNLGYIYTLVFLKKWYATASLVQGIGAEHISYVRDDRSSYHKLIGGSGKLHVRLALRYDSGRYFLGTMGLFDYFLFNSRSSSRIDYSFGKCLVFGGYRFSILKEERKLLRRLKLIDY